MEPIPDGSGPSRRGTPLAAGDPLGRQRVEVDRGRNRSGQSPAVQCLSVIGTRPVERMHDTDGDDIAPGTGGRVDIVDLESNDVTLGGHQLSRSGLGAENQFVAQQYIRDRRDGREGVQTDRDPAD
jgi:hypothetical protein